MGLLPPLRADVRGRRARHPDRTVRGRDRRREARAWRDAGHRPRCCRAAGADRALPGLLRVPHRPARAADAGDPCRIRLVGGPSRGRVPPHQGHPGRVGHCGQRAADGLRQQGQDVGVGRRLLARRDHRRPEPERRLPARRAGRGRCVRRAHPARHLGAAAMAARTFTHSSWTPCVCSSATSRTCRTRSSPWRRAGSTCSRPAAPSVRPRPRCALPWTLSRRAC